MVTTTHIRAIASIIGNTMPLGIAADIEQLICVPEAGSLPPSSGLLVDRHLEQYRQRLIRDVGHIAGILDDLFVERRMCAGGAGKHSTAAQAGLILSDMRSEQKAREKKRT